MNSLTEHVKSRVVVCWVLTQHVRLSFSLFNAECFCLQMPEMEDIDLSDLDMDDDKKDEL